MTLVSLAIDYKTASIDVRTALALESHRSPEYLKILSNENGVQQVLLLSTCNRTEIYLILEELCYLDNVIHWWQTTIKQKHYQLTSYIIIRKEADVVKHLMKLAVGLSSMVLGEPQILGQIKQAYNQAILAGTIDSRLHRLFQQTFAVAKRIRYQTGIGRYPISIAYSAVYLAKKNFNQIKNKKVLIVGAGKLSALLVQQIKFCTPKSLFITNRTLHKAIHIAEENGAFAYPLSKLNYLVQKSDIIIMALSYSDYIIDKSTLANINNNKIIIDLSVPRTVNPNVNTLLYIKLYSVDDIKSVIQNNKIFRKNSFIFAERAIQIAVDTYLSGEKSLKSNSTITALREKMVSIIDDILQRHISSLNNGGEPTEVITRFAHDVTNKLLHIPIIYLKQAAIKDKHSTFKYVEKIFGL